MKAKTTSAIPIASSRIINSQTNQATMNRTAQQQVLNNNANITKSNMQNVAQGRQSQPNRLLINNENYGLSNIRKHSAGSVEILNEKINSNSNERLHGMQVQQQQRSAHLNRLQHNTWKSKSTTRINQMATGTTNQQAHVRRSSSNRTMPGTPGPVLSAANSSFNLNQSAKLTVVNRNVAGGDTSITQFAIADDISNYGQATTGAGGLGRSNAGGMTQFELSKWCASFEDDQDDADNSANDLVQVDDLAAAGTSGVMITQSPSGEDYQNELNKKLKQTSLNDTKQTEDGITASSNQQQIKCLSSSKPINEQQLNKNDNQQQLKDTGDNLKCIVNSNSSQKIRLQIIPSNNLVVDTFTTFKPDSNEHHQSDDLDRKKPAIISDKDEDDDDEEEEDDDEDDDDDDEEEEVELVILEKKIIKNGKVIQVTEEIIEEKSIPKQSSNKNHDKKINKNQVQDKNREKSKFFEFLDEPDGRITNIVVKTSSPPVLTTAKPVVLSRQQVASPSNKFGPIPQDKFNSIEKIDTKKNSVNESDTRNQPATYKEIPNSAAIRRRDAKRSPISLRSYSDPEHFTGMKETHSGFLYAAKDEQKSPVNERKGSVKQPHKPTNRSASNIRQLNQLLVESIVPIKQRFEKKLKRLNLPRSWSCPLISSCIRSSITPPLRQQLSFQSFNEDIVFNLDITRNIAIICGKSDNQLESSLRKNSVFCYNGLLSSSLPNIHLCLEEDRIPLNEPCTYFKHNNLTKEESGGSSASNSSNHLYNQLKGSSKNQTNKSDTNATNQNQPHYGGKCKNQANLTSDSEKCDDIPPQLNKTTLYSRTRLALQSVDDQDDDEIDEDDEQEETDPNYLYKKYTSNKLIPSPPDGSAPNLLMKSYSGSTGRMNRLGSCGSTTAYNSAVSSITANRSPYNQVTRSSTTSNICNYSTNANLNGFNAKLSSGFNSSLTGLSSLTTTSSPLTKFNVDMPMPFRRMNNKKRTTTSINTMFNNNSPLSSTIYNTANYTFNNHLTNYNGSYTNLHNLSSNAKNAGGSTGVNSSVASKYLPSSEFFLRQSITSSPSSSSSANLSSGNYLSNYLTNNQTSSPLSHHHHHSSNSYLTFKSSASSTNAGGLGSNLTSNYRPLQNSYSSTNPTTGYNSSNLYSNRLIAGLSTQPTADTDLSFR